MKTIIDKNSGKLLYAVLEVENLQPNELAIDELLTETFVNPYFNFETREFYDGATLEEIVEATKPIVPFEVPLWAMRTILKQEQLFNTIIGAIQTLDEPIRSIALDFLEYGNYVERYSNTTLMIQQITQKSDAEVDQLFINAEKLKL